MPDPRPTLTIDRLAICLRGIPRDSEIMVEMLDGTLARVIGTTGRNVGAVGGTDQTGVRHLVILRLEWSD